MGVPSAAGAAGRGPTIQLFKDDAERQAPSLENKPAGSDRAPGAPGTIGALARGGLVIDRVGEEKPTAQALASQEGQSPKLGVVTSGAAIEKAASEKVEKEKIKTVEQGKGRWFVQVAAARTRAEANAMNKKLARAKLKGKIEEAKVGRNTYYRVVVGPYSSKDAATVARGAVKRAKAASGEPFVRQAQ